MAWLLPPPLPPAVLRISLAHPPRDHDNHHGSAELEHELAQDKDKNFIPCNRFIRKVRGYEFKTGLKVRARGRRGG